MYQRGEYRRHTGRYAAPRTPQLGRELTDAEMREATDAGNRAAAPLEEERRRMMLEWRHDAPLSRQQMARIMSEALGVARRTVSELSSMIDKVPSQWEAILRNERNIINRTIDEAPKFERLMAGVAPRQAAGFFGRTSQLVERAQLQAGVVPGFRDWISRLFKRSADGITAIHTVAHILPDWLRMVGLLDSVYSASAAVVRGIVRIASAVGTTVVRAVEKLPDVPGAIWDLGTIAKWTLIGGLAIGGVFALTAAVSHLRKGTDPVAQYAGMYGRGRRR